MLVLSGSQRIFVSVAAYRDSETPATVRDLLEKADRPHLISVGVLNQISAREDLDCRIGSWTNVHECVVDYRESKGACWARNYIFSNFLQDEEFVLQIDSHSRFDQGWDTSLLKSFEQAQDPMGVLTCYPVPYNALTNTLSPQMYPKFDVQQFNDYGIPIVSSRALSLDACPKTPEKTILVAGGCLFTRSKTIKAVPYDPHLYFEGEEVTYAIRLWTNGYNLYLPNKPFMYHDYGRERKRPLHWSDNNQAMLMRELGIMRAKHLLDIARATNPHALVDIDKYSLGRRRTLSDWERFSGVNIRSKVLLDKARNGSF